MTTISLPLNGTRCSNLGMISGSWSFGLHIPLQEIKEFLVGSIHQSVGEILRVKVMSLDEVDRIFIHATKLGTSTSPNDGITTNHSLIRLMI